MELPLIKGMFSKNEALDLITQLINVKINFHEEKIKHSSNEEDMKVRETRIKQLQDQLQELRNKVITNEYISVNSVINIK